MVQRKRWYGNWLNRCFMNGGKENGFTLIELLAVIIILGILMIIAIPSVTEYINSSRRNAYIITAKEYVASVVNKVNALYYNFMDDDTTYYVPISCIPLEKGGDSPFGEWRDAYVIVTYNGVEGHTYYWTSLDSSGYKVEITDVNELDVDSLVPSSYALDNRIGIEGRKWLSILDKDTCEIGMTVEAESNFGNQRLANVVSVGDFVNYDAGVWNTTVAKPTTGYKFGGYTNGNSRNNSVSCAGETSLYNGWRVIEVKGDIVKLIHAGSSECYYHPNATNSGCASTYILRGEKLKHFWGYCSGVSDSFYSNYQPRDWSVYVDNKYAYSATSVSWLYENMHIWDSTKTYNSAQEFVNDYPKYDFVLTNSDYADCVAFSASTFSDVVDNGARGKYWLGAGHQNNLHSEFFSFGCDLRDKEYGLGISTWLPTNSKSYGVRPVITLKARVKTSGQVEQVVGTNGTTKAMVWQLVE